MDYSAVVEEVSKSVVTILTKQLTLDEFLMPSVAEGLGSGFSVSKNFVVTSYHVIQNARNIIVVSRDGFSSEADVVAINPFNDLALLYVKLDLKPLKLQEKVKVGEGVLAVGSPLGLDSVTLGIISSVDRTIQSPLGNPLYVLQTDAAVNPGNSGGPLVNTKGEVVGVVTAMIPYAQGIGFAIPSKLVISFLKNIEKNNGKYIRPYLGIRVLKLNKAISTYFNLPSDTGVLVVAVDEDSPAFEAGVRRGDIITEVNGKKVESQLDLVAGIDEAGISEIEIKIIRGKNKGTIKVTPVALAE
ncbi:trypsin-like peptidase domain-containing protein [Sulfurisphaera javensis]|uniref:Trypsin-like peptidase domain-containing protein n=1 Tax=Sulfurisphaera javensis TaxID=2049879 RepID=A0AAT9GU61_9CREN